MRGVGVLDIIMVIVVLFLLLMTVIAVGLIDSTGSTVFDVDVDDALIAFERAQYGKPIHQLLTIEQQAPEENGVPGDARSIAESLDRNDGRASVVPPRIALLAITPLELPNTPSASMLRPFTLALEDEELPVRTIESKRQNAILWTVQIDEYPRYRIASTNEDAAGRGRSIVYAIE